jgi:hypothetical protein
MMSRYITKEIYLEKLKMTSIISPMARLARDSSKLQPGSCGSVPLGAQCAGARQRRLSPFSGSGGPSGGGRSYAGGCLATLPGWGGVSSLAALASVLGPWLVPATTMVFAVGVWQL